jgi:CDP-glucose 4,6-dehydratase
VERGSAAMAGLVSPDPDFWRGRCVLVTGHTGFQGSWLTLWLSRLGAKVIGFALPPSTNPSLFDLAIRPRHCESVTGDIRDRSLVTSTFAGARPEIVFHLAAQALVGESYRDPVATFEANLMGTVHVLEALRTVDSLRAAVFVTSDKCYENLERETPYDEEARLGGRDPYSNSKACAELAIDCYRRAFYGGSRIASARAGNVIGGGDWSADRLIPDLVRAAANGSPIALRNPAAVRPWQHVLEPLSGCLRLAECLTRAEGLDCAGAWNFGPAETDSLTVSEIVERAQTIWGGEPLRPIAGTGGFKEAGLLRIDSTKALSRLGWRRRLPIDSGLAWTLDWYRRQLDGADAEAITITQIERYEAL